MLQAASHKHPVAFEDEEGRLKGIGVEVDLTDRLRVNYPSRPLNASLDIQQSLESDSVETAFSFDKVLVN